jgi:hypothetical protein
MENGLNKWRSIDKKGLDHLPLLQTYFFFPQPIIKFVGWRGRAVRLEVGIFPSNNILSTDWLEASSQRIAMCNKSCDATN